MEELQGEFKYAVVLYDTRILYQKLSEGFSLCDICNRVNSCPVGPLSSHVFPTKYGANTCNQQAIALGLLLGGLTRATIKLRVFASVGRRLSTTSEQGAPTGHYDSTSSDLYLCCTGGVSAGPDHGSASQEMPQLLQERMPEPSSLPTTVSALHDKSVDLKRR
nr:uncharacterized protein LOC126521526 [Dermacentor andersoni]